MAKWFGKVGYVETKETAPGVWRPVVTVKKHYGDEIRNTSSWSQSSETTNGELTISNQISIVANPYAYKNFQFIRYVEFMGTMWTVANVKVLRPRLILTLGGVYNGEQA